MFVSKFWTLLFASLSIAACLSAGAFVSETSESRANLTSSTTTTIKPPTTESNNSAVKKSGRGNPTASDRLMKELARIQRSESYKKGLYEVKPIGDSLYEWRVRLFAGFLDASSQLHKDLIQLGKEGKKDHVELNFYFKGDFPFGPPFVRVVYPSLKGNHFYKGGALCMELLSPGGWSSAYKLEAVIMDIGLLLVDGGVSILSGSSAKAVAESYTAEEATKSYGWIWDTERWRK